MRIATFVAISLGFCTISCPAMRQPAYPGQAPPVARPAPCAEIRAVLIGKPARAIDLDVKGLGPARCRVDLTDLELRQQAAGSMLVVVRPSPRSASVSVATGETQRVHRDFRLP